MEDKKKLLKLKQGISDKRFLVPNLVTVGNLFCGFLAILYSTSDRFDKAVLAIIFAILLDGLDGRVARKLNASTKFGVEFDSFSDLVSFGIAPAVLIYNWAFKVPADEFGVFITFLYVLSAAVRLARFNIADKSATEFEGLPSPGAAAAVVSIVYCGAQAEPTQSLVVFSAIFLFFVSIMMVSQVKYLSIKHINIHNFPKWGLIAMSMIIPLSWYKFKIAFLIISVGFLLSGPLLYLLQKKSFLKKEEKVA